MNIETIVPGLGGCRDVDSDPPPHSPPSTARHTVELRNMSYSLNSVKGVIWGSIIGVMKGDPRSLHYS